MAVRHGLNDAIRGLVVLGGLLSPLAMAFAREPNIAISLDDGHSALGPTGKTIAASGDQPDTIRIIDLARFPPRLGAVLDVPGAVDGPPRAVWVSPDASWAIVVASAKRDPADRTKLIPADDVTVVALAPRPHVVQRLHAQGGAGAVAVSLKTQRVIIVNKAAGSLSTFTIASGRLTPRETIVLGPEFAPTSATFLPDGRTALIACRGRGALGFLRFDADGKAAMQDGFVAVGPGPNTLDIAHDGRLLVSANMGSPIDKQSTVSLVDLKAEPFREIARVAVAAGPESIAFSPDGAFVAVGSEDGSNRPDMPHYHASGLLQVYAVSAQGLTLEATAPTGAWLQGLAFSRDGATILAQGMQAHRLEIFRWVAGKLTAAGVLPLEGGPASIGTPW